MPDIKIPSPPLPRVIATTFAVVVLVALLLIPIRAVSADENVFAPPKHWLILGDSRSVNLLRPQSLAYTAAALGEANILANFYAISGGQLSTLPSEALNWLLAAPVPASPSTIFIMLGVNDANAKVAMTTFSAKLVAIVRLAGAPTTNAFTGKRQVRQVRQVICVDLPPTESNTLGVVWQPYASALQSSCPKVLKLLPPSEYYYSDGVHLTLEGNRWLIDQLINYGLGKPSKPNEDW